MRGAHDWKPNFLGFPSLWSSLGDPNPSIPTSQIGEDGLPYNTCYSDVKVTLVLTELRWLRTCFPVMSDFEHTLVN